MRGWCDVSGLSRQPAEDEKAQWRGCLDRDDPAVTSWQMPWMDCKRCDESFYAYTAARRLCPICKLLQGWLLNRRTSAKRTEKPQPPLEYNGPGYNSGNLPPA